MYALLLRRESRELLTCFPAAAIPKGITMPVIATHKFKSHGSSSKDSLPKEPVQPRHDPNAAGALVLYRPKEPFDKK